MLDIIKMTATMQEIKETMSELKDENPNSCVSLIVLESNCVRKVINTFRGRKNKLYDCEIYIYK